MPCVSCPVRASQQVHKLWNVSTCLISKYWMQFLPLTADLCLPPRYLLTPTNVEKYLKWPVNNKLCHSSQCIAQSRNVHTSSRKNEVLKHIFNVFHLVSPSSAPPSSSPFSFLLFLHLPEHIYFLSFIRPRMWCTTWCQSCRSEVRSWTSASAHWRTSWTRWQAACRRCPASSPKP